jgi:hypothetical protein
VDHEVGVSLPGSGSKTQWNRMFTWTTDPDSKVRSEDVVSLNSSRRASSRSANARCRRSSVSNHVRFAVPSSYWRASASERAIYQAWVVTTDALGLRTTVTFASRGCDVWFGVAVGSGSTAAPPYAPADASADAADRTTRTATNARSERLRSEARSVRPRAVA